MTTMFYKEVRYVYLGLLFGLCNLSQLAQAQSFSTPAAEEACIAYNVCMTSEKLEAGDILQSKNDKGQLMLEFRCQKSLNCTLTSLREGVRVKEQSVNYNSNGGNLTPRAMLNVIRANFATRSTEYYMNGQLKSVTEIEFDAQGDWIRSISRHSDRGILLDKTRWHQKYGTVGKEYICHSNGNIKIIKEYSNTGRLESKTEFDEQGKQILNEAYYPDGSRK